MDSLSFAWLKGKQLDLFVESFSNATRTIELRGLTKNEQIGHDHTTNNDRTLATSAIGISEIPLFLTARTAETSVSRGETYVKVSLRVNQTVVALLFAGYVTDAGAPIFPGGEIRSSVEGPGLIRSITSTNPAANVEIVETVPTGARWRFISLNVNYVTDATGGNRTPTLNFDDGTTIFLQARINASVTASITATITAAAYGERAITANLFTFMTPPRIFLAAGFRVRTAGSFGISASDDYDAPQLLVEEWLEP